jgi:hypothetical protein
VEKFAGSGANADGELFDKSGRTAGNMLAASLTPDRFLEPRTEHLLETPKRLSGRISQPLHHSPDCGSFIPLAQYFL